MTHDWISGFVEGAIVALLVCYTINAFAAFAAKKITKMNGG